MEIYFLLIFLIDIFLSIVSLNLAYLIRFEFQIKTVETEFLHKSYLSLAGFILIKLNYFLFFCFFYLLF